MLLVNLKYCNTFGELESDLPCRDVQDATTTRLAEWRLGLLGGSSVAEPCKLDKRSNSNEILLYEVWINLYIACPGEPAE